MTRAKPCHNRLIVLLPLRRFVRAFGLRAISSSAPSALDVQHADQREEPPRGGKIGLDLAFQPFKKKLGSALL